MSKGKSLRSFFLLILLHLMLEQPLEGVRNMMSWDGVIHLWRVDYLNGLSA